MANQDRIEGNRHASAASVDACGTAHAVEGVYRAFERHRRPLSHVHCEHCVSEADEEALCRRPLRELESRDISKYAFKAMTTWGTEADFKHLLPRILELTVAGTLDVDAEVVLGKLTLARWHDWPVDEVSAVRRLLRCWWCEVRASEGERVLGCLAALSCAKEDLGQALSAWWDDGRPEARACMLAFLALASRSILDGRDGNAFWEGGMSFIDAWFGDRDRRDELLTRWLAVPSSYGDYPVADLLERWGAGEQE